jgi:polysaccharide biosynthesis protein PslA
MELTPPDQLSSLPLRGRGLAVRDRRLFLYALSAVMDVLSVVAPAFVFAQLAPWDAYQTSVIVVSIMTPFFVLFAVAREVQSIETLRSRSLGLRRAVGSLLIAFLMTALTVVFLKIADLSRLAFAGTVILSTVFLVISEVLFTRVARLTLGGLPTREALILDGCNAERREGMEVYDVGKLGLSPDLNKPEIIDALSRIIAPFDRVVIACIDEHRHAWATLLKGSEVGGEIMVQSDVLSGAVAIGRWGKSDTLIISRGPLSASNRAKKRAFDIVVASAALIALAPLLIVTAIAIRLDSPGPVLFRQQRVGLGNRLFSILKFRSMRTELSDLKGDRSASRGDPRITRVGRFIRRTSIDELPQIINVLRGDMSMVGPRPHALGSLAGDELFWEVSDSYWIRHALKPGITGLAQVNGSRGATDNREELERRIRYDLEYLSNWSLMNDFMILVRTFKVIVHDKAY